MNTNALFKIGYGLYILSCHENGKDNACIVNTVMQVTSNPCKIAICINKTNHTCKMLKNTRKFNISVLDEQIIETIFNFENEIVIELTPHKLQQTLSLINIMKDISTSLRTSSIRNNAICTKIITTILYF